MSSIHVDHPHVIIDLYTDERRLRTTDDPDLTGYDPGWRLWFYWDGDKLERGEWEFLGVEAPNIERIDERDLVALDRLGLPRIDVPEAGLFDVTVSDALRWARRRYPSRYSGVS